MNLQKVEDTKVRQKTHRFGIYEDDKPTILAIKVNFKYKGTSNVINVAFDFAFDVIQGDLRFLLGIQTLIAMGADLHLKYMTLSFSLHNKYHRLKLVRDEVHVYLPFNESTVILDENNRTHDDAGCQHYSGTSNTEAYVTNSTNRGRRFFTVSPADSSIENGTTMKTKNHGRTKSIGNDERKHTWRRGSAQTSTTVMKTLTKMTSPVR